MIFSSICNFCKNKNSFLQVKELLTTLSVHPFSMLSKLHGLSRLCPSKLNQGYQILQQLLSIFLEHIVSKNYLFCSVKFTQKKTRRPNPALEPRGRAHPSCSPRVLKVACQIVVCPHAPTPSHMEACANNCVICIITPVEKTISESDWIISPIEITIGESDWMILILTITNSRVVTLPISTAQLP